MIKVLVVLPPKLISMERLDDVIASSGAKAYVAYASSLDADMRYLTRFRTTDPVVFLQRLNHLLVLLFFSLGSSEKDKIEHNDYQSNPDQLTSSKRPFVRLFTC